MLRLKIKYLTVTLIILANLIFVLIIIASLNQYSLNQMQEIRHQSHKLADELRTSSDELTRMVRTYVVTGDPAYEKEYWHILAVRNGEQPMPDGQKISIRKRMEKLGFSRDEFEKLKEAEDNSNRLVFTEQIAMNAVKGKFIDDLGKFTRQGPPNFEMARKITHDNKYHQDKEMIMHSIRDVDILVEERSLKAVKHYIFKGNLYLIILAFLAIITTVAGLILGSAITKRKKEEEHRLQVIEELKEAIKNRDEFLSVASHELRTPLTPLLLRIDLMISKLNKEKEEDLKKDEIKIQLINVRDIIQRLIRLINNLLDISRIAEGGKKLSLQSFDLVDVTKNLLHEFEGMFTKLGYKVELKSFGPVLGKWDKEQIEQVITNLLQNAFKYGAGKPITVLVNQNENLARIEIKDQGIGIDKKDQERIFERYVRAVKWHEVSGLGLGLYITKAIVEGHGGKIHLESELGQGSTFLVELPLEASDTSKKHEIVL